MIFLHRLGAIAAFLESRDAQRGGAGAAIGICACRPLRNTFGFRVGLSLPANSFFTTNTRLQTPIKSSLKNFMASPFSGSNPHVGQHAGDAVDQRRQLRMARLEFPDRRLQAANRMLKHLRILALARRLAGGHFSKGSDAFGLFVMCLGKFGDFGFKFSEQLEQFRAVIVTQRGGILNSTLNF
jgi:hypothetical protein